MSASLADSDAESGWQPDIRFSDRDSIVSRSLHSCDERLGFRKNHRFAFVRSCKLFHRVHRIESQQRNEFHFVALFPDKQFRAVISGDLLLGDAGKNFAAQHVLVRLRVRSFRPAVPDPRDHIWFYRFDYSCSAPYHASISITSMSRRKGKTADHIPMIW